VDYRVAPEKQIPTAINDAYTVNRWLPNTQVNIGERSKVILNALVCANLAALVVHKAKKESTMQPIKLVVMLCPPTDNQ